VGDIVRQRRLERFIQEFGELALAEYGLPPGIAQSQAVDFHPVFQVAFVYVTMVFPSGSYPMLMDKIIFDPELLDEDLVQQMIEDYENVLDEKEIIERLKKAELIEQNYKEKEEDGQET